MRYRVRHRNRYQYGQPVSLCHSHAKLLPRDTLNQQVLSARLTILPLIEDVHERQDLFGNRVSQFSIDEVHTELMGMKDSAGGADEVCALLVRSGGLELQNEIIELVRELWV